MSPQQYIRNSFFKTRPVVEELAKAGLDVCWYDGWQKRDAAESLRQFNAIWLMTEHEDECPCPAEAVAAALKDYVNAGGGLVIAHSAGRYPEAPVDAFWKKVMAAFGLEILHEEICDDSTVEKIWNREVFFTDNLADHPVTKGVPGLWLPLRTPHGGGSTYTWGSVAVRTSPEWTAVVSTGAAGKSYRKDPKTNVIDWSAVGTYASGPVPIVNVREFGKGRVVFLAVHKDNCGWMYGIDKWPNLVERGELKGRRSDMLALLGNALRWASVPSMGMKSFLTGYTPVEWKTPPYVRVADFGERWRERMSYPDPKVRPWASAAKGVIGLHSALTDGESSVADFAAEAKRLGLSFIAFADPLDKGSKAKLEQLRRECAAVSDGGFHAFPGVEFTDMNGTDWFIFHDKVEWPMDTYTIDGRTYRVFDGTNVLQRGKYSAQNLYRGGMLNTANLRARGILPVNIPMYNLAVPRVYDGGRLVADNEAAMLQAPVDVTRVAPVSFTRIRRAADLASAAATSVTVADSLAQVEKAFNVSRGQYTVVDLERAHLWVRCGEDVAIRDFAVERIPGTDVMQCVLAVASGAGLAEVKVMDGAKRVLARFDAHGEKEFSRTFSFVFDSQSYAQLIVTDAKGRRAYSFQKWVNHYHAGLNRCSDNNNLLSCNPELYCYLERDDIMIEPAKAFSLPPEHFHFSESRGWGHDEPSRLPTADLVWQWSRIPLKGIDYPSEKANAMPSSLTSFPLVMPNVVTIIDQRQGDWVMTPTRTETRGVFGRCSDPVRLGEGRYWRRRHRVYQFCDRTDKFWRLTQDQVSPEYRGGYAIVEGEIEFTEDVELADGVPLVGERVTNPIGALEVYGKTGAFARGDYYAAVSSSAKWYAFFGLGGSDPLRMREAKIPNGLQATLLAGEARAYRKGERIRYRYATGSFIEHPHDGEYLRWVAGMLDGSRFRHEVRKGRIAGVDGLIDLVATNGEAAVTFGPTWFIQRYPVRIRGLADNGCACYTDGDGIVKPLAFCDGLAYAEIPLEKKQTWWFGNLYLSDNPNLRLTYVPDMPGHPQAELQIHNPTDREIIAKVWSVRHFEVMSVRVPAGSSVSKIVFTVKGARGVDNLRLDFHNRIREGGGYFDFVLLGDSISYNWRYAEMRGRNGNIPMGKAVAERAFRGYSWLNLGIGGDNVQGLTWRCQHGELDGYRTPLINILIGTNNRVASAEEVAKMIGELVKVVRERHPESKILLNAILPRGPGEKDPCDLMAKNNRTNELLKGFCDGEKVVFVDWGMGLLKADGTINGDAYMFDGVHPGEVGYDLWAKTLLKHLRDGR